MTLLRLTPTALSRCRFALSPLAETLGALITLHRPAPEPWLRDWHARHQPDYRAWLADDPFANGLLALVSATKFLPDLVAIPPTGGTGTDLRDELAAVAALTDAEARSTVADAVASAWEPQEIAWSETTDVGPKAATVLAEGWRRYVAPDWPRRRALLERDIMHRAGLLAAYGWKETVRNMTRHTVWVGDDAIRFSEQDHPDRWITDEGLVFVPKTTGVGAWTCERPPLYALVYPARGPAAEVADPGADPLGTLLGTGRARVLRELRQPATSTQLAYVLELSLGTISAHLAVLRDAGVVSGARVGRAVVYRLTERGTDLLALTGA